MEAFIIDNYVPQISTRYLEPSEYELWDRFVDTTRLGSIYNQSFFLHALCQAIGTQFRILAAFKNNEMVGGMGLHYNSSRYGDMIHIRPLLYYNGLVISDFDSKYPSITSSRQTEVINAILDELESGKYAFAEFSSTHPLDDLRPFLARLAYMASLHVRCSHCRSKNSGSMRAKCPPSDLRCERENMRSSSATMSTISIS
jgi:hypothetical protein